MAGKPTVKIYGIIAQGIVEFDVTFHETYGIDQTSDGGDNAAVPNKSVSTRF